MRVDRASNPKRMDISAIPATQILLRNTMRGVIMKQIELTQGKVALVDDKDFEWLSQWKWHAIRLSYCGFTAKRTCYFCGQQKQVFMHRIITNAPTNMVVDHKNHNTLDNQRHNLRVCTKMQNQHNRKKQEGSSKYKGVYWYNSTKKWCAAIKSNNKRTYLGYFDNEMEAAKAYDVAAKKLHGEFANLNY